MLLVALLTALAAASTAPAAGAATTVVADPAAQDVTALDGTLVWISGTVGSRTLMQHDAGGDRPVAGARPADSYRSIDLGRDRAGAVVREQLGGRRVRDVLPPGHRAVAATGQIGHARHFRRSRRLPVHRVDRGRAGR
jgi:hypothetical protein